MTPHSATGPFVRSPRLRVGMPGIIFWFHPMLNLFLSVFSNSLHDFRLQLCKLKAEHQAGAPCLKLPLRNASTHRAPAEHARYRGGGRRWCRRTREGGQDGVERQTLLRVRREKSTLRDTETWKDTGFHEK